MSFNNFFFSPYNSMKKMCRDIVLHTIATVYSNKKVDFEVDFDVEGNRH